MTDGNLILPKNNPDLFGLETVEESLLQLYDSGRLPHALLFSGPEGVGKATLAYRMARFLLANPPSRAPESVSDRDLFEASLTPVPEPRGFAVPVDHPVFRQVSQGAHPDLLTIERVADKKGKIKDIGIDDVRRVSDFLHLTAAESGWRVVILDSIDDMTVNAANALLKMLEEPPPRVALILICHNIGRALLTIRSRCRRIVIPPIEELAMQAVLTRLRPDINAPSLKFLSRIASGSVGRALFHYDQESLEFYEEFIRLLQEAPNWNIAKLHSIGDRFMGNQGEDRFFAATEILSWWFKKVVLISRGEESFSAVMADEHSRLARFLYQSELDTWLKLWEKSAHLFEVTGRANLDRKQSWLLMMNDIARAIPARADHAA